MTRGGQNASSRLPIPDQTHDAVVVVPGIMGSELIDNRSGRTLWGMNDLSWYVRAWSTGSGLDDLRMTEEERGGRYGRVTATRLLKLPAFFRIFAGWEPYTGLVADIRKAVIHPAAVLEFAYDWRLPIAYNGARLAQEARDHLDRWRTRPAHETGRRRHPDGRRAQLVFVAHSMGGLLTRHAQSVIADKEDIRATITLGTPFYGSAKATWLLNTGRGAWLPARKSLKAAVQRRADEGLRKLVATLPGVHDLLPVYRCLAEGQTSRRLTPADVEALGGDRELAANAIDWHASMEKVRLINHRAVVGVRQPTAASLRLTDGVVTLEGRDYGGPSDGKTRMGDGTVSRGSASLAGAQFTYLPQQHTSLAKTDEVVSHVVGVLTEQDEDQGPSLGTGELGMELPDLVLPGETFVVRITGIEHPVDASVEFIELATGGGPQADPVVDRDGRFEADLRAPRPGLFRVRVRGGGAGPAVEQLVLAVDPDAEAG